MKTEINQSMKNFERALPDAIEVYLKGHGYEIMDCDDNTRTIEFRPNTLKDLHITFEQEEDKNNLARMLEALVGNVSDVVVFPDIKGVFTAMIRTSSNDRFVENTMTFEIPSIMYSTQIALQHLQPDHNTVIYEYHVDIKENNIISFHLSH